MDYASGGMYKNTYPDPVHREFLLYFLQKVL